MGYNSSLQNERKDLKYPSIGLNDKKSSFESILRALANGDSIYDILVRDKELSTADIFACLNHAAELVAHENKDSHFMESMDSSAGSLARSDRDQANLDITLNRYHNDSCT
ncbi:MAG: hypothetical protein KGM98_10495 [Bacteroidota bacterium]|nr:hypothetical protein [Bacteroidota bacterium]